MKTPDTSIRYPIGIDAGTGRLAKESDFEVHVRQLMLQVLFTNPGERINRPDFGCGIRRMVFAPNSNVTASLAQITVIQALEKWLGDLIDVADVQVRANNELLEVHIAYSVKASQEPRYLNLEVPL